MELRENFRAYLVGWFYLLGSLIYIVLWQLILALPLIPFVIFLPDHLEGHAPGGDLLRLGLLVAMLLWVPVISYKLGMLRFESDVKEDMARRRKEPEVQVLRALTATGPEKTGSEEGESTP